MRRILQTISWLALIATIVPPVAYLGDWLDLEHCKQGMLVATIVWFVVTPCWMGRENMTPLDQPEADGTG